MRKKTFVLHIIIMLPSFLAAMDNQRIYFRSSHKEERICCLPKNSFGDEDCL